jgi:hypothetical protein
MTPEERAEELIIKFDFNGYVLYESNEATTIKFAIKCADEIRIETDNKYQYMFYQRVIDYLESRLAKCR